MANHKCSQQGNPIEEENEVSICPQAYELPLYETGWSIYLELVMLDTLTIFGVQNWMMVSKQMKCKFSPDQVRDHYYRVYGKDTLDGDVLISVSRPKTLVEQQDFNIYAAALAREKRKFKVTIAHWKQNPRQFQDAYKRIPSQLGYDKAKGIFLNSQNEQAEGMLVGLRINPQDSPQVRRNKIQMMKRYNQLIMNREYVQSEVMRSGLMECKFSITRDCLTIPIPSELLDDQSESRSRSGSQRRCRPPRKGKEQQQQNRKKWLQREMFFRMKRKYQDGFSDDLRILYNKIKKYDDEKNVMKSLLQFERLFANFSDEDCEQQGLSGEEEQQEQQEQQEEQKQQQKVLQQEQESDSSQQSGIECA